jgi:hypothetical protein
VRFWARLIVIVAAGITGGVTTEIAMGSSRGVGGSSIASASRTLVAGVGSTTDTIWIRKTVTVADASDRAFLFSWLPTLLANSGSSVKAVGTIRLAEIV